MPLLFLSSCLIYFSPFSAFPGLVHLPRICVACCRLSRTTERAKKRTTRQQGERSSSSRERTSNSESYPSRSFSRTRVASPRLGIINTGPVECRSPHSLRSPRAYLSLPSSSPLIPPPPVPPYPASSLASDQFPCPCLGPNGGLRQPLADRGNRKPS